MEGDRWACLARHALARGLPDIVAQDPLEPLDILREYHVLNALEIELKIQLLTLRQQQYASGVGFTPVNDPTGEIAVEQFKHANSEYLRLGKRLLPYLDWQMPEADTLASRDPLQLRGLWESIFGMKVDDPRVLQFAEHHKVPEPPPKTPRHVPAAKPRPRRAAR